MMYIPTPDYYNDYIAHFNPFHNPKNGQFSSGHGGSGSVRLKRKEKKNLSDSRIADPDIDNSGSTGIRMKNGDILFVDTNDVKKYGVDKAIENTNKFIKNKQKAKRRKEQAKLAKSMINNYDTKDPDAEEAKKILNDIYESNINRRKKK